MYRYGINICWLVSTFVDWITCLCPRRLAGPNGEETGQDSTCWMLKTVPVLHIRRLRTTDLRGVYDVETFPKHIDKPSALTFYLQHGDFNPCQSALQYDIISQKKLCWTCYHPPAMWMQKLSNTHSIQGQHQKTCGLKSLGNNTGIEHRMHKHQLISVF